MPCSKTIFFRLWFLTFLHRRSVTIGETLRIIQVYDFNCPTLLVKSLQRMRLEAEVERYSCLRSSFVNTSLLQRTRSEGKERLSNTLFSLESRSAKDQKHPPRGWLPMMKRSMLSRR